MFSGWQFTAPHVPLQRVTKEDPVPEPGQVLVETRAAGLCHSDVGFLEGTVDWMLSTRPIILGHEVAGVIAALGPEVEGWSVGDRVAIAGLGLDAPGLVADGGFGQKLIAKVEQLISVPDSVPFDQAAAATNAGQTARKALRLAGVGPGTRVGIIGVGGLGLTGARMAVMLGAEVYAAEVNEKAWDAAREAGVQRIEKTTADLADLELDVFVDYAGFGTTTAQAITSVKDGGLVVQVGLGRSEATIDTAQLVAKQVTLVGSLGGSPEDTADVIRLMGEGLTINTSRISFEEIPEGLERLQNGDVSGRLIAEYEPATTGI
jgi:propanol-preferring alcohol dehydrogenase